MQSLLSDLTHLTPLNEQFEPELELEQDPDELDELDELGLLDELVLLV